jgi:hypothetical protein
MGRKAREKQIRNVLGAVAVETADVPPTPPAEWGTREWTIAVLLIALTFAIFGQVASHAFLNLDDGMFVYENQHVLNRDVSWALTSGEFGWYPLTWLSHMLDVTLFGQRAGMHLLTSVFLHALSTLLLFLAMRRLTRTTWPSAFIAALFAIHPMHVEPVAWIAERRDTLSTLFAMLALWLYARAPRRMLGVSIALALSLMAKQTYITLPFVFLLLDVWPLNRLRIPDDLGRRFVEKWPLFILTIVGSIAAITGQSNVNAVQSTAAVPIATRIANALIAYVTYLRKLFVPTGMALPYSPLRISFGTEMLALLILAAITIAVLAARRVAPYLAVGWLWFAGTLVPLSGIVALGAQPIADRFTYFAYIGLFIALTFGAIELAARVRIPRAVLAAIGGIAVALYAALAVQQLRYWKDSYTLFSHTLDVTRDNSMAEYLVGQTLQLTKPDAAIVHLRRAIALAEPQRATPGRSMPVWYSQAFVGLGMSELLKARSMPASPARTALVNDGIAQNRRALEFDPDSAQAKTNIATGMQMLPPTPALSPLQADYDAYLNEGTSYSQAGRYDEAVIEYRHAVELFPQSVEAHIYLGLGLIQANKRADGVAEMRTAKMLSPIQANDFLTKAIHLPPNPSNLDGFITQMSQ